MNRNFKLINRLIRPVGRVMTLLTAIVMVVGPAAAADWPWAVPAGRPLGGATLVIVLAQRELGGPPPQIDRLIFNACLDAPCKKYQLETTYLGPRPIHRLDDDDQGRFHYLHLNLPPGEYRLTELSGRMGDENGLKFKLPLKLKITVRANRTAYLGRLTIFMIPNPDERPLGRKKMIAGKRIELDWVGLGGPDAVAVLNLTDAYALDAGPLIRAWPKQRFSTLERIEAQLLN